MDCVPVVIYYILAGRQQGRLELAYVCVLQEEPPLASRYYSLNVTLCAVGNMQGNSPMVTFFGYDYLV